MRTFNLIIHCPFYVTDKDDFCDAPVEITVFPAEKATMEYPGSPASFEVSSAPCGHGQHLETGLKGMTWDCIRDVLGDIRELGR